MFQTALPSALRLDLAANSAKLAERLGSNFYLVVYGESGTGKSALVKTFLETRFPKAARVRLAPKQPGQALDQSAATLPGLVLDKAGVPP